MELRPYQKECCNEIEKQESGSYLCRLATGLGKTIIFTHIKRHGRVLVLAHRDELVHQPIKYYDCKVGVEMASESSHGEPVVIASVPSLINRLGKFTPGEFDTIITDECHHSAAPSYKKIYNYLKPRLHIGFTATPQRPDHVRLDDVFDDIIYNKDLRWGIKNKYLSDIYCRSVEIGYDLSGIVPKKGEDFNQVQLDAVMEGTDEAVADAYKKYAKGPTIIFASSVRHACNIADKIPDAVPITAQTKNRNSIIKDFTDGKIPCLTNYMVLTEGVDIPRVETVIIARPTVSNSLYCQMVGRGLRLYPGKKYLNLIDCSDKSGNPLVCSAPSLLGIDYSDLPGTEKTKLCGNISELPAKIEKLTDNPIGWIKNITRVNFWAKEQKYNTHGIDWYKMPDGKLVCGLPNKESITIPCEDELGHVKYNGKTMTMQEALDSAYKLLIEKYKNERIIWDINIARKRWGNQPASEKQLWIIHRKCKDFDTTGLTKMEASQILNRIFYKSA